MTFPTDDPEVREILEAMTPEQRVGQLFLVTFVGSDVSVESEIGLLVREKRVGGVVLEPANDNFVDDEDLPLQLLQLANDIQALATDQPPSVEQSESDDLSLPLDGPYVPLFVALELEAGVGDYSSVITEVALVPTSMSIGATWSPTYAEQAGMLVGTELDALGINMILGPSLDVLEEPQANANSDLGVTAFGGDPFWVAEMGEAYVSGVHQGSSGRVAVIPQHFPGLGSADRPADVEVSTVPRSLSRLVQVDLAPFFAVTGNANDDVSRADGVVTAHIRYLGFQGDNPRLATRPISLDPQALQVLMEQPQIAGWRQDGGLVVSGPLGQRSIRRFYDPSEATFPNRRLAQDAFLAGNDILYVSEFQSGSAEDRTQTQIVVDTIDFFVQKYNEDPMFQARVDQSVARILRQKLDQFGAFTPSQARRSQAGLSTPVEENSEVTVEVAQAGLTLLSPSQAELIEPPGDDSIIVIFTDTRSVALCSECEAQPVMPVNGLSDEIMRLYGPSASGLVEQGNIQSFSFVQLSDLLDFGPVVQDQGAAEAGDTGEPTATPEPNPVEVALGNADWVVFLMLDQNPEIAESDVVKRFLAERPDLASEARVVVMAMEAPYYLDSTEISKLSAYYALYDSSPAFVSTAARALFQEALPQGASPVSVSGVNYDILEVTSPDPAQVIELYVGDSPPEPEATPAPLELEPGDSLQVQTAVIHDYNGNPVPDGTPVEFIIDFVSEGLRQTESATTIGGVAQVSLVLNRVGQIEVTAASEPAQLSSTLSVNVPEEGPIRVVQQPPEVTPTAESLPTEPPLEVAPEVEATPTPLAPPPPPPGHEGVTLGDLFLTMVGLLAISALAFRYGQWRTEHVNDGLSYALPSLIGGFLVYNYYALGLSGPDVTHQTLTVAITAWSGGLLGFLVAGGYKWWRRQRNLPSSRASRGNR